MERIIIKQKIRYVLMMALVMTVLGTGSTRANKITRITSTCLVQNKDAKFVVETDLEYTDAQTEKILAGLLYKNGTDRLMPAMDLFMKQFDKYHEIKSNLDFTKYEAEKYSDGKLIIGAKYHGGMKMSSSITDYANGELIEKAVTYEPFYYYKRTEIPTGNDKMAWAGIILDDVKGVFTYDKTNNRLLNVTEVFTENAMKQLGINGSTENTEVLVRPFDDNIAYAVIINGKKIIRDLSLTNNAEHLVGDIRNLAESMKEQKQKIEELRQKMKEKATIDQKTQNDVDKTTVANEAIEPDNKLVKVEQMPTFPGGDAELLKWLSKNIRYPAVAEENGVQGRVILRYVVGADGSINNVSIIRSVDPSLDKEAMRVVKAMPNWNPGIVDGKPVPVWFTLPVTFQLGDSEADLKKMKKKSKKRH